jgi:Protein of unknown function (DUF1203)
MMRRMQTLAFQIADFDTAAAARLRAQPEAIVYVVDEHPGYPCRQCRRDAEIGDEVILVSHDPFTASSPYRSASPVFIHRASCADNVDPAPVPAQMTRRLLSVRCFDEREMMIDATVVPGTELRDIIERFFANDKADHIHVHNAERGCWAGRVDRAH